MEKVRRLRPLNPQAFFDSLETEQSPGWPVITLDFNGVLDRYPGWRGVVEVFEPAEGVREFLEALRLTFNTIVIQSATRPISEVEAWVEKYGFDDLVDFVTTEKLPSVAYVDDRAVRHDGDFNQTLHQIYSLVPHWKRG